MDTQRMTMVTVIRAWIRAYGVSSVLSALYEAARRERRRDVGSRRFSRN